MSSPLLQSDGEPELVGAPMLSAAADVLAGQTAAVLLRREGG